MGMYDSVYIKCDKCGKEIEFQSKAGDCELAHYYENDYIPLRIKLDVDGRKEYCKCGEVVQAKLNPELNNK